nr:MAG TPA: hypothetical protein [Caudoviricetes sp.]
MRQINKTQYCSCVRIFSPQKYFCGENILTQEQYCVLFICRI